MRTRESDMLQVHDLAPEVERMRADVLAGLRQTRKRFPSQYLYDARGARLFERICELDEYYLTRTENAIMAERADELRRLVGPRAVLIEPGSGAGEKAISLLARLDEPAAYVPIDVAGEQLARVAATVNDAFPDVEVLPICADFTESRSVPLERGDGRRRVIFFPGSTIGNFDPPAACRVLRRFATLAGPQGGLLIGVDLKKDRSILEPAYDDARGVSAAFARNVLVRLNRELNADFRVERFGYEAPYNEMDGRIEMALVSRRRQEVQLGGTRVRFAAGERIVTEYSYKYDPGEFAALAGRAGLTAAAMWTDAERLFGVFYLEAAP